MEQQAAQHGRRRATSVAAGAGVDTEDGADVQTDRDRREFLRASSRMRRIPLPKTKTDYSAVSAKTDSQPKPRVRDGVSELSVAAVSLTTITLPRRACVLLCLSRRIEYPHS